MSEEFFERLRERAYKKAHEPPEENANKFTRRLYNSGVSCGIAHFIDALKEMMVGEPLFAKLRHRGRISATPYTVVEFKPGRQIGIGGLEHIHTDGEEVMVMVVRLQ